MDQQAPGAVRLQPAHFRPPAAGQGRDHFLRLVQVGHERGGVQAPRGGRDRGGGGGKVGVRGNHQLRERRVAAAHLRAAADDLSLPDAPERGRGSPLSQLHPRPAGEGRQAAGVQRAQHHTQRRLYYVIQRPGVGGRQQALELPFRRDQRGEQEQHELGADGLQQRDAHAELRAAAAGHQRGGEVRGFRQQPVDEPVQQQHSGEEEEQD